jgi:TPR repeat protein
MDLVLLIHTYAVDSERVARVYERRGDWSTALVYHAVARDCDQSAYSIFAIGYCHLYGMNAVATINETLGRQLLTQAMSMGCVEARTVLAIDGLPATDPVAWLQSKPWDHRSFIGGVGFGEIEPPPGVLDDWRYADVVRAAECGCVRSQMALGNFLHVYRPKESKDMLKRAVAQGHMGAMIQQWHYFSDFGSLQLAARSGYKEAMFQLGYEYTTGPHYNNKMATFWLERAAAAGHLDAADHLRRIGYYAPPAAVAGAIAP